MGAKGGAMLLDLPGPARRRLDRRPPISTLVIFRFGGDDGGLRRALSPTFPAGELVFFIPLRVVAEEPGAAHFGLGGAMLLDPLGPALRLLTHVADFHFSDIAFGATMELGRSERTTMRPLWSYGVDGASTPDRKPR
jgi:hypothetical protein